MTSKKPLKTEPSDENGLATHSPDAGFQATAEYREWLAGIKKRISGVQLSIALAANSELIRLYYDLGNRIVEREQTARWGSSFIDCFSRDLKTEFPCISGFSAKNLRYCRAFFRFYSDPQIWQQAVAKLKPSDTDSPWRQTIDRLSDSPKEAVTDLLAMTVGRIPWGHNIHIFSKARSLPEALFYLRQTLEQGWSRDVLVLQVKSDLYSRSGKAVTNFHVTLPAPHSDLAQQTLKDPYTFDFLTLTAPYNERDVEKQLVNHITRFLLELGKGFAFVGQQYHLKVDGTDYAIDLLFYHTILKCYFVVELKNKRFEPEFAGKLNFYLSAVDSLVKREDDNPTIGLLLCRDKSNIEVEFSLRDLNKPMGVSEYNLTEIIPANLVGSLPTVAELEENLERLHDGFHNENDKGMHL